MHAWMVAFALATADGAVVADTNDTLDRAGRLVTAERLTPADGATTAGQPVPTGARDPWMAPDKVKHGVLSLAMQGATYAALRAVASRDGAVAGAAVVTMSLGVLKERFDRERTGFSVRDLVWDAAGILVASLIVAHAPRE